MEFHWLVEAYTPEKMYGKKRESEIKALYEKTYGAKK